MELVEQRREEKWLKFKRQKLKTAIEHSLFDLSPLHILLSPTLDNLPKQLMKL